MVARMFLKMLLSVVLGTLLWTAAGCSSQEARPAALTGEQPHERHATGIDSQVNDM